MQVTYRASLGKPIVHIAVEIRSLVNLYRIRKREGMWTLMIYLYLYRISMQEDTYTYI